MFYEAIGALVGRAAEALAADDPSRPADERGQRERRQTIKLLRRIGVIWPKLFRALAEESAILEATLQRAVDAARAQRLAPTDGLASSSAGASSSAASSADPLERYRRFWSGKLDRLERFMDEEAPE